MLSSAMPKMMPKVTLKGERNLVSCVISNFAFYITWIFRHSIIGKRNIVNSKFPYMHLNLKTLVKTRDIIIYIFYFLTAKVL